MAVQSRHSRLFGIAVSIAVPSLPPPYPLPQVVTLSMTKIHRGKCLFLTWEADHSPQHVHVYKDAKLVLKWNLIRQRPMKGVASRRVRKLLRELHEEGLL